VKDAQGFSCSQKGKNPVFGKGFFLFLKLPPLNTVEFAYFRGLLTEPKNISIMGNPANCISVATAKQLQKNWNDTRAREIDQAQGSQDTFEFTFDIDELQEYIDYVKEEAKKQQLGSVGLRLFFAAYDDSKSKKATIFLCPSASNDANSNNLYSIDPFNNNTGGWPPKRYE
jgi:hypothetical protein